MIDRVEPGGFFIGECALDGERRADGAWPAMAGAQQLSADRWLILYSTRGFLGPDDGFTGSDNDRSVVYQLRADAPTGPVIKEAVLKRYRDDWDVLGDGRHNLMQHCHAGVFGVPLGAHVRGRRVAHENVFVASWYRTPRAMGRPRTDADTKWENLADEAYGKRLYEEAFCIEWVQFRLVDDGNDIEVIASPEPMRQVGYEQGEAFCAAETAGRMNRWYVPPVPYDDDCSQWVHVPHFQHGLAAVRFAFNAQRGLYEWVETGPLLRTGEQTGLDVPTGVQLTETSTLRYGDSWLIAARSAERGSKTVRGIAWMRTDDLFKPLPEPVYPGTPMSKSPCSAFACPDGALRLLTNDVGAGGDDRNPLFIWDVNPDEGFGVSKRHTIFDAEASQLKVRDQSWPRIDMPNLLPHAGGHQQTVTYRVRLRRRKYPHTRLVEGERQRSGCYCSTIHYADAAPPAWSFA